MEKCQTTIKAGMKLSQGMLNAADEKYEALLKWVESSRNVYYSDVEDHMDTLSEDPQVLF